MQAGLPTLEGAALAAIKWEMNSLVWDWRDARRCRLEELRGSTVTGDTQSCCLKLLYHLLTGREDGFSGHRYTMFGCTRYLSLQSCFRASHQLCIPSPRSSSSHTPSSPSPWTQHTVGCPSAQGCTARWERLTSSAQLYSSLHPPYKSAFLTRLSLCKHN